MTFRGLLQALLLFLVAAPFAPVNAQSSDCGDVYDTGYGPFDYTNQEHVKHKLPIVERAHFTSDVEKLIRGKSSADPMGDIAYTLQRFPNHHRALYAMVRYMLKKKRRPHSGSPGSPECWFQRASTFAPSDGVVLMLKGIYEHKIKAYNDALASYARAETLIPTSGELQYNIGLLHFAKGDYESSAHHARRAYEYGYQLPGLKRKLARVGKAHLLKN